MLFKDRYLLFIIIPFFMIGRLSGMKDKSRSKNYKFVFHNYHDEEFNSDSPICSKKNLLPLGNRVLLFSDILL
jgi:hypothetical protein